jgi:hypothetical protein
MCVNRRFSSSLIVLTLASRFLRTQLPLSSVTSIMLRSMPESEKLGANRSFGRTGRRVVASPKCFDRDRGALAEVLLYANVRRQNEEIMKMIKESTSSKLRRYAS